MITFKLSKACTDLLQSQSQTSVTAAQKGYCCLERERQLQLIVVLSLEIPYQPYLQHHAFAALSLAPSLLKQQSKSSRPTFMMQ